MTPNATANIGATRAEVMASVDSSSSHSEFIIADISCDEAWISMRVEDAPSLRDWA
ncbi:hypothetical protein SAMN04488063_0181 [Halopelagius inordinatus]|uniref:Uncharacterized protein n=1 Tax=Halopelagius inordinatus TaxID=553467 RepID=A0A1I2LB98_9EURY|nr:hypothetical protein [Halopelagius inordinatus]SFF76253.1 hypothetical protein SAMN04488063_0181 [Halopelagius inordinatus]